MRFNRDRGRGGFGGRGDFRGRGRGGYDIPKPVKVGEEYDVEISEVGSKGDGICRIKNFIVFVNGAKKGEKIKIKITDVMSRFAVAEKVGKASATSEEPAGETAEGEKMEPEEQEETMEETEEVEEKAEDTEEEPEEAAKEESEASEEEHEEETEEEAEEDSE